MDLTDDALAAMLKTLFQKSTVTPFRRHGSRHKCYFCTKTFQFSTDLREHTLKTHSNVVHFEEHIKEPLVKLDVTDLKCKVCLLKVESMEELLIHLNKDHGDNITEISSNILCFKLTDENFSCIRCDKKFKLFGSLLLHINCDHLDKKHICEACETEFKSKSELVKHTKMVHSMSAFVCPHCDKRFLHENRRDSHVKYYHESQTTCVLCSGMFSSKGDRDRHMYSKHSQHMKWFKCERCPIRFKLKHLLSDHVKRVHLKEKNVTCEICGMTFFRKSLLKIHMVKHSDAKPFECATCAKKFSRKSALKLHIRIHTNERRYVCKVCGRAFIQWTSLQYHLPQHSDERNFQCVACLKAFKTKKTMLKHCKTVHGKNRPEPKIENLN